MQLYITLLFPNHNEFQINCTFVSKYNEVFTEKSHHNLSTHMATPMPPPIQREATPLDFFSRFMAWRSVTRIRHPEAPIG